ncbi:uncharacterized protein N7484_011941 [Penicillium longicatenatum]|uniref:uncharacterized protein n=1 Tax=Penicillium longicatenatum TaxID=1561947 RepID=UPI0025482A21|nr:uncharacterized protein N7484_011941 [Penicillium longicatenatum]KAJ5631841.1 hypothetical protein N7484_011941 [Penicillium longicatenatum]
MPSKKHNPPARKKGGIHFVNARPTSEIERLKLQRVVRAHVGRWISAQTSRRLQNSSHLDGVNLQPNRGLPSDKDGPSHSFTLVSRPFLNQPQCWNLPASETHDLPLSFTDPVSCSRNLPAFSPHESESSESGDESITLRLKATSATLIPWNEILGLDRQVSGQIDPFMTYPSHLGAAPEVVDACQNYCLNTMWPGVIPGQGSSLTLLPSLPRRSWFKTARSDPALFSTFMYGSLCHQRILWANGRLPSHSYGPTQHRLLEKCETDSIILINQAVRDPSRAISDSLLLSVVCMAHHAAPAEIKIQDTPFEPPFQSLQWLDVYGCLSPNVIHLQGLVQLLKLRGGLRNIKLPGLAAMVCFSEIFIAAAWCIQPIFEFWPLNENRLGTPLQELIDFGPSDIQHGFGQYQVIGFTPQMAEAFQAARTYIKIIEKSEEGLKTPNQDRLDESLLADQRNLTEYTLLTLVPSQAIISYFSHPTQGTTYEACRLAGLIFGVGVIFPIPQQNSPLQGLAKRLCTAILQPTAAVLWSHPSTRVPLIWILILGGIAASGSPDRSFFVSSLADIVRRNNVRSWTEIRLSLDKMLWHEGACEKAGRKLWCEVDIFLEQNPALIDEKPQFSTG